MGDFIQYGHIIMSEKLARGVTDAGLAKAELMILRAACAGEGHQISWTSDSTDVSGPPPGEYFCDRCQRYVEIEDDHPPRKA